MPKFLAIDDDEVFRKYLATLLSRTGYEVRSLPNDSLAAAVIESEHVDAVISDLYMPNVDDLEILSYVKRRHPGIPVIGISISGESLGPSDPCSRAMTELGADAVLSKPLDDASLLAIVRGSIDNRRPATAPRPNL